MIFSAVRKPSLAGIQPCFSSATTHVNKSEAVVAPMASLVTIRRGPRSHRRCTRSPCSDGLQTALRGMAATGSFVRATVAFLTPGGISVGAAFAGVVRRNAPGW